MTTDEQVGYVISALRGHLELTTAEAEAIAISVLEALPSAAPHIRITCDMEAYALAFNEGYETAMDQHLAPEVETATEWLEEQKARVRYEALARLLAMAGAHEDEAITPDEIRSAMRREFK